MAKTTVQNPGQAAFIQMQKELASQGVSAEHIDRLLTKSGGIEEVFKDIPALRGYFSNAAKVLAQITQWDYDFIATKAVPGAVAAPGEFKEYYQNQYDVPAPVAFREYIPAQYFENPQMFVQQNILSQEQADAMQMLLHGGGNAAPAQGEPVDWSQPSGGDTGGQGGQGAPGSKAYGTGGTGGSKAYGSGSSKAYGSGKTYAGGGPPGPPPGGGYGGGPVGGYGYGDVPSQPDMSKERDYINTLSNDPNYGLLSMFYFQDYGFRSFGASVMQQLERVRQQKAQLTQFLSNLDPTDPRQAQQLRLLTQQQSDLGTTERELMDKLGIAQRSKDEMVSLIKSMMDTNFKTMQTIISNTKG